MANIITYENFNADNIVLSFENKKALYSNDTYQFKKFYPKYRYEDGTEDDIYIQIPEVMSFGIKTFEDKLGGDQPPAHSFSFLMDVKPNPEEGIDEDLAREMTEGTINIFDAILKAIKTFLKQDATIKTLGKMQSKSMWNAFVDNIKPFISRQVNKDTGEPVEGSSPTLFLKLKTELTKVKPAPIKTIFRVFNPDSGSIDELSPSQSIEKLQGVRCNAMGVVHIESIFIPKTNNLSIQFKLHEVLVTEIHKRNVQRLVIPNRLRNRKVERVFDSDDEDDRQPHSSPASSSDSKQSDDEATEPVKPKVVKRVVRRLAQ